MLFRSLAENIDSFFQDVNSFNSTIEEKSLVEEGFITIDSLEPEYDYIAMMDLWDASFPEFIGYNCRIVSYHLMKDVINIGKPDTSNAGWMVFDENALEYNPIEVFNQEEHEAFRTLYSSVPAELTKDITVHLNTPHQLLIRSQSDLTLNKLLLDYSPQRLFLRH